MNENGNNAVETPENKPENGKKNLIKEFLRYCVAGGVATLFDYAAFALLFYVLLPDDMGNVILFGAEPGGMFDWDVRSTIAQAVGFIVGLTVNNLISIFFVFKTKEKKSRGKNVRAFIEFSVVGVIGFILSVAFLQLGCRIFGLDPNVKSLGVMLIKAAVTAVVFVWNYIGRKFFANKSK
ncbi:MAG: GtrA family protein [Clostridia bacterium]|nr:GtrA family protein [Clostridia bacterium]